MVDWMLDYDYCSCSSSTDGRSTSLHPGTLPWQTYLRSKGVIGRKDLPVMMTCPRFNFDQTWVHLHFLMQWVLGADAASSWQLCRHNIGACLSC